MTPDADCTTRQSRNPGPDSPPWTGLRKHGRLSMHTTLDPKRRMGGIPRVGDHSDRGALGGGEGATHEPPGVPESIIYSESTNDRCPQTSTNDDVPRHQTSLCPAGHEQEMSTDIHDVTRMSRCLYRDGWLGRIERNLEPNWQRRTSVVVHHETTRGLMVAEQDATNARLNDCVKCGPMYMPCMIRIRPWRKRFSDHQILWWGRKSL